MARLPKTGSDNGTWGDILNDYLSQTLKTDGTFKDNIVSSAAIAPNAVTAAEIAPNAVTATEIANGTITEAQLTPTVQTKLNAAAASVDWSAITNKPTVIAAGADQATARTVIGAGTSNLTIGTTSLTAKAGNYLPTKTDVGLSNVDNTSDTTKNSAAVTLTNKTMSGASNTFTAIPEGAITNLTNDLTSKVDKASLTSKGDMYIASASSTPTRLGIGTDGQVLTVDSTQSTGVKWAPQATNLGYVTNVGDGTSGPYTISHNLGSRDVLVNVYKNGDTYEEIMVRTDRVTKDTVILRPDEVWTTNQYRAVVGFITQSDVTAPSAPTLVQTAHDISSVSLSLSGSTDAVGVVGYNWYRNSVYIASTTATTYIHTGLNSATSYSFTATAVDLVGNESVASNVIMQATDTPANVAYVSSGSGSRNTASGVTSWTHVIASGVSRYVVVGVVLSNTGGHWQDVASGYSTKTITSDIGTGSGSATFTLLGSAPIGANGQPQGNVLLYGLSNAAVGTHTISSNFVGVQGPVAILASSAYYSGVGSIGTAVSYQPNASGSLALTVPSAANNYVVGIAGFDAAPSGFNQTTRYSAGGSIGGQGDYGIFGDSVGGSSISFTTSSTAHYRAGVGINLVKVP